MKGINKVHCKDWLENELPNKSVQLIMADPPYFEVKGSFDFVWGSFEDYLKDVEKWAIECKRVLADNGSILWFGDAKKIAYTQIIFDKHFRLLNSCVWDKGNFLNLENSDSLRSFAPCTERFLCYSSKEKDNNFLYEMNNEFNNFYSIRKWIKEEREKIPYSYTELNFLIWGYAQKGGGIASNKLNPFKTKWEFINKKHYKKIKNWCKKEKIKAFEKEYEDLRKEYEDLRKEYEDLRRPFNNIYKLKEVIKIKNEAVENQKYNHETVKPKNLTRMLIETCSRAGDLVLVPFAGSGTECAMAARTKRNFIGFDIEQKYVEMANKRINYIFQTPTLF